MCSFKITDELIAERLKAIDKMMESLPENSEGAIADTYDNLQGIPYIELSQIRLGALPDIPHRVEVSLLQTMFVVQKNISILALQLRIEMRNDTSFAKPVMILAWMRALSELEHSLIEGLHSLRDEFPILTRNSKYYFTSIQEENYKLYFDDLLELMNLYISSNKISARRALAFKSRGDSQAQFIHDLKNFDLYSQINYEQTCSIRTTYDPVEYVLPYVLSRSVLSMQTHSSTYLTQFRATHQIPELLASQINELMHYVSSNLSSLAPADSMRFLDVISFLIDLVNESQKSLIELMFQSEYFKIRRHLGVTSGSKSKALADGVLTKSYYSLAASVLETTGINPPESEKARIFSRLKRIRRKLLTWRDLHIAFPRNVLGSGDTKSLIGSSDVVAVILNFRRSFLKNDPVTSTNDEHIFTADDTSNRKHPCFSDFSIVLSGELSRDEFTDVQHRTGRYSRNSKSK